MHRFFVPAELFQSDPLVFPPETSHQISAVLHLKVGQRLAKLHAQITEEQEAERHQAKDDRRAHRPTFVFISDGISRSSSGGSG